MAIFDKPLFIFEMANNHQGSVEHGKNIIKAMAEAVKDHRDEFDFAFKFQYRDLDTFIRPDYADRDDIKNIKRFKDTRLSEEQFLELRDAVRAEGMYAICTGFDEVSVDRIKTHGYDILKIASCSFGDWPMLEEVAKTRLPIIASTAGATLEDMDSVIAFFEHRNIPLTIMHCVAEYPTPEEGLELNQIDFLKTRYPKLRVGFSTHEDPADALPVMLAVAKNVRVFEKHVGLPTDMITLNGYSANPDQVKSWVDAAHRAYLICGDSAGRYKSSEKEQADLAALKRGVFAKSELKKGDSLRPDSCYYAFPCEKGQLLTSHLSKYAQITVVGDAIKEGAPIYLKDVMIEDEKDKVQSYVNKVMRIIKESGVTVPLDSSCEISHHYGLDTFEEIGLTLIDCINREYCKKILVVLPGQKHPVHFHKQKEETFTILHGSLDVICDDEKHHMEKGESMTVNRGVKHSFSSEEGCVFEEISTTHYKDDSFYDDQENFAKPRKTKVYLTAEMIKSFKL